MEPNLTRSDEGPGPGPAEVVAGLDRAGRVRLLSGSDMFEVPGVPEHGLDPIVLADGPHGLRRQPEAGDHLGLTGSVPATCFPTAATLGSSWDVDLLTEVGRALGEEAVEQGVAVVLGPGLNIKRHPAGGRCFEYLSEDPLLSGRLAAAMVRGIQSQGVGACLKHYAVNNHESHRLIVDAVVDERTLREVYLAGFEVAVRESDPWTVMCAYNLVNGTYASQHHHLLTEVLRDEWGFDGLLMTDWGAADDRVAGVRAGLDLEMPGNKGVNEPALLAALEDGSLTDDEVAACAERVVGLLRRARRDRPTCDMDAHHRLARRAAAAGTVLLTNRDGVLPLSPEAGRVAVVGAFAETPRYQGAGSSQVNPTRVDSLLDLVRERLGGGAATGTGTADGDGGPGAGGGTGSEVSFAPGYDPVTGSTTPDLVDEAVAAAEAADVVVLCVGLPAAWESEGFDRRSIDLPDGHVTLIEALAAGRTPVVVSLSNGGVVHMPWADRVAAVVEGWLGGQAGAGGTVDVLFGDAEPGGRLAETIPEHVAQLPADRTFPGSPRQCVYREGPYVGYRFFDTAGVAPRFPFGHGLSYTRFEWSDVRVEGDGTDITVSVRVANVGDRAGSDVVQVYVRDRDCTLRRPDKELRAFAKVHLDPGASEVVTLTLDRRAFAVWDVAAHDWLVEAGTFDIVVARSSADPVAEVPHEVASADELTPVVEPAGWVATEAEQVALMGRPLPPVPPSRPFHRNSTLEEVETTRIGRLLAEQIVKEGQKRAAKEFPDPDEATLEMVRSALRQGPLRALVLLSGGMMKASDLDGILAALNGDWSGAGRAARQAIERLRP